MGKPAGGAAKESLTITDNRTGKTFEVPIKDNTIPATALKNCKISKSQNSGREEDEVEVGVRVFDPGVTGEVACILACRS